MELIGWQEIVRNKGGTNGDYVNNFSIILSFLKIVVF